MFESKILLHSNLFLSAYMLGVILLIQWIHYPTFHDIQLDRFIGFHQKHTSLMGLLVGPAMLLELFVGWALFYQATTKWFFLNLVFILALWLITFFISVPLHNKLALGYNKQVVDQLVYTNWFRTGLWFLKSLLAVGVTYGFV